MKSRFLTISTLFFALFLFVSVKPVKADHGISIQQRTGYLVDDCTDTIDFSKSFSMKLTSKGYGFVPITSSIEPYNFWNKYDLK
ncbi:hypothetical protein ABID52_000567 [Fictibacillus halophilus]|uniref:Uncharacterized protein n=1 Tax=Fictibacillus halophilus TaxID=1610490 RepID=A0ABV2LEH3_9BACL|nr:hypothetical protein [Fictibacillus halophilus]